MRIINSVSWHHGLCLALFLMLPGVTRGEALVCYVDSNPRHTSVRGGSWETPLTSLQRAIDLVFEAGGGEVWVKSGVYKPETADRTASFVLRPKVTVLGGFRGTETTRSERNPKINRTILSGEIGTPSEEDNSYHIVTAASSSLLDGFIVSKGNANGLAGDGVGAGVLVPDGTRNFQLLNCTLERNNASWQGAAVYAENASLTITNCLFFSNTAASGGGLATKGSTKLKMQDSLFSSNYSTTSGGAIELPTGIDANLWKCSFMYNRSQGSGGAVAVQITKDGTGRLELVECNFTGNIAQQNAGAILISGTFSPVIKQCRFEQNAGIKGAGAIGNANGVEAVVADCSFRNNKGIKGAVDIGVDTSSRIVEEREVAEEEPLIVEVEMATKEEAQEMIPPENALRDILVHQEPGSTVPLADLLSEAPFTILVMGDLTDSPFIENYRDIEATAKAYRSSEVQFYYIYRYLAHPENNGYLQPYHILERARQAQLAASLLRTRIPWLLDTMDNQVAMALEQENSNNNVYIFSSSGRKQFSCSITELTPFRKALENIAGSREIPGASNTPLPPNIKPVNLTPPRLLDRVKFDPSTTAFHPLKITPQESRSPYYVKLRAEASEGLLASGDGKVYLGFHIDPLYGMEWNNNEEPLKYTIRAQKGVVAPSIKSAPRITDIASDVEPREFVLDARQLDLSKPIPIQVEYCVCSADRKKRETITQRYFIHLEADPFAGNAYRRQTAYTGTSSSRRKVAITDIHPDLLKYDANGDGRLERKEVSGTLYSKFPDIDTNGDGNLSDAEYSAYLKNR